MQIRNQRALITSHIFERWRTTCGSCVAAQQRSPTVIFTMTALTLLLAGVAVVGCRTPNGRDEHSEAAVRAALDQQVREWNAGNLAGFMETYAKAERTRFAAGGDISLGWQTVFERYQKKYGTRAAMGTLRFSDLEITMLGPDAALAFGRWHLKREGDAPSGLFTLIFRQTTDGWRIVHDHTSAAATQ